MDFDITSVTHFYLLLKNYKNIWNLHHNIITPAYFKYKIFCLDI